MPAAPTTLPATKDSPVPWWLWPQVLSLDAPVVIVLWQAALAHTHRMHLPAAFSWGLGLVTWFVYVLDRTADAISGRLRRPTSARHAFYFQHRKAVLGVVLPLTCLAMAWLALTQMPIGLLWQGLGLAMLGAFYLAHFSARRASPLHWLFMLLATLFGLVLIAGLPMPDPIKVLMSGTLVGVMLIAARRRFDSRWRSILPKEVPAALLIALGCAAGVHFWSPEDHSLVCIEVKLMCCLFLINLLGIRAYGKTACRPRIPPANAASADWQPFLARDGRDRLERVGCPDGHSWSPGPGHCRHSSGRRHRGGTAWCTASVRPPASS